MSLYWLDPQGQRKPDGVVHAGQKHARPTFTKHAWVVTNPDGAVQGIWVAIGRPGRVVIE